MRVVQGFEDPFWPDQFDAQRDHSIYWDLFGLAYSVMSLDLTRREMCVVNQLSGKVTIVCWILQPSSMKTLVFIEMFRY